MTKHIDPQKTFNRISKKDGVLIDVRSKMECAFVGYPLRSFNIPWIDNPNWQVNSNFTNEVTTYLLNKFKQDELKQAPIFLLCRSGVRSIDAGEALIKESYTNVYSVDEGFEGEIDNNSHRGKIGGWRFHGLPWIQS